jgi:hypothetical protein
VVDGADTASEVLFTVTGFVPVIVQSPGAVSVSEVSTLVGPYGPLLWRTAEAVTLKEAPALAEAGLETETLFTFTSELPRVFVLEVLDPLLFPDVGSETCS